MIPACMIYPRNMPALSRRHAPELPAGLAIVRATRKTPVEDIKREAAAALLAGQAVNVFAEDGSEVSLVFKAKPLAFGFHVLEHCGEPYRASSPEGAVEVGMRRYADMFSSGPARAI